MLRENLLHKMTKGVTEIHDNVFPDIEVKEIFENNVYVNKAIDKYLEYFNYVENKDKYNLKYCFRTTLNDLNTFYRHQENKITKIKSNEELYEFEHEINLHIYEEVKKCQKRVNRVYWLNTLVSYCLAFMLIFGVTEIFHQVHLDTIGGTLIVALLMAAFKLLIDKRYLEVVRKRFGWKSYRFAVKRSLVFYFVSLITLQHIEHVDTRKLQSEKLVDFRLQIEESINILLSEKLG